MTRPRLGAAVIGAIIIVVFAMGLTHPNRWVEVSK